MRTEFLHEWTEKDIKQGYTDKSACEALIVGLCILGALVVLVLSVLFT